MVDASPALVLDQAVLLERYRRGEVELLPILRQIEKATVRRSSLEPERDFVEEVMGGWDRVPVIARVCVVVPEQTVGPKTSDRLAEAILQKSPEFRSGIEGAASRRRRGSVDAKRYRDALRPKLIAPIGRMDKSITIQNFGPRRVGTAV
jgi:hypothetical protein